MVDAELLEGDLSIKPEEAFKIGHQIRIPVHWREMKAESGRHLLLNLWFLVSITV